MGIKWTTIVNIKFMVAVAAILVVVAGMLLFSLWLSYWLL